MQYVLRTFGCVAGGLLIYVAVFLHEDEERNIQNRLVDFWSRVYDRSKSSGGQFRSFMIEVCLLSERFIDRVFGKRLFSLQLVLASFFLATYSLSLEHFIFFHQDDDLTELIVSGVWAGLFALFGYKKWMQVLGVLVVSRYFFFWFTEGHNFWQGFLGLIVIPAIVDIAWLYVTRRLLSKAASGRALMPLLLWETVTLLFCLGSAGVTKAHSLLWTVIVNIAPWIPDKAGGWIALILYTRWFLLAFSVVSLVIAAGAIVHRHSWFAISRLVYPLQRHNIVTRHKTLFVCGAAMIKFGVTGNFLDFLEKVAGAG